jgi:ribonuclease HI
MTTAEKRELGKVAEPLVYIYADESCLGNQHHDRMRPGGAAGLLEYHHPKRGWVRRDYWTSEADTTNNRMAIRSALVPLSALRVPSRVIFTSDSRYLVDAMTRWIHDWVGRGWRRKGGEVENVEAWQELLSAARRHRVEWRWVRGHAGHAQNEYANHLAVRAAREQSDSRGLVESAFEEWISEEQEAKGRYLDFLPPAAEDPAFRPGRLPAAAS